MARDGRYKVRLRRRREGKTDFKLRKSLLLSEKPRLVLRKSSKHMGAQIITSTPQGDIVHIVASSKELATHGWKFSCGSVPAAYLTGLLLAKKSAKQGFSDGESILDMGLATKAYGSRIFSALKGAVDGGFEIKSKDKIFPPDTRINGTHIADYAKLLKKADKDKDIFNKQFKNDPTKMVEVFDKVKKAILKIK